MIQYQNHVIIDTKLEFHDFYITITLQMLSFLNVSFIEHVIILVA